jgi:hypothetical protein
MNLGLILTIIGTVVGWIVTIKLGFNDLKHLTKAFDEYVKKTDKNFEKIWKKIESNGERISRMEGKTNGK